MFFKITIEKTNEIVLVNVYIMLSFLSLAISTNLLPLNIGSTEVVRKKVSKCCKCQSDNCRENAKE